MKSFIQTDNSSLNTVWLDHDVSLLHHLQATFTQGIGSSCRGEGVRCSDTNQQENHKKLHDMTIIKV